jgi:alanine racemase
MTDDPRVPHAEVVVDLTAIRHNVATLARCAAGSQTMAVVKANGYGHGLVPTAWAAKAGGAQWLGTAVLAEALRLRSAGLPGRVLSWLAAPGEDYAAGIRGDIDLAAYATWQLAEIAAAAEEAGRPARVHLKVDTGLSRGGATAADWPDLLAAALQAQRVGTVEVVGIWSHLAYADEPGNPTIAAQQARFDDAVGVAERRGLAVELRHLANSAATLTVPDAHYELVRPGLSVYGLSPIPAEAGPDELGLRPAMSLRGRLSLVKEVPAGAGVSYGHAYITAQDTRLGLVPLGYADGIPRHASNTGPLLVGQSVRRVAGRVCMDQLVVDLGPRDPAQAGDEIWLWGDGSRGEPTAEDWAQAAGTISYEIVTRVSPRLPTTYLGWEDLGLSEDLVGREVSSGW